jgi:hypothetical protein
LVVELAVELTEELLAEELLAEVLLAEMLATFHVGR